MINEKDQVAVLQGMLSYLPAINTIFNKACEEKDQPVAAAGTILVHLIAEYAKHTQAVITADRFASGLKETAEGFGEGAGEAMYNMAFNEAYNQMKAKGKLA